MTEPARYAIRTPEDDVRRVAAMPEEARRVVEEFIDQHLKTRPTARIRRRLKMLTGDEWAGHYQFDVDRNHRLIYTVNEAAQQVLIQYIGPHPDWSRSRPGAIAT